MAEQEWTTATQTCPTTLEGFTVVRPGAEAPATAYFAHREDAEAYVAHQNATMQDMPLIEAGDWFYAYGDIHAPMYPDNARVEHDVLQFYHLPLAAVSEIRKANGRVWKRAGGAHV